MTRLVDLTQPWGDRMPTWPQFASIEVTDITTHHRDGKSTVLVTTNMHTGTHIDAPIHYWPTGKDLGAIPIQDLYGSALVVDLRPITKPWSYYSVKDVLGCLPKGEQIREGDIVLLYTGWDRYNWTKSTRDDVTYFDRHPGPQPEVCDYLVEHGVKMFGGDLASMDHSLHVRVRYFRPDLVKEYEAQTGKPIDETLPMTDFEHVHYHMAKATSRCSRTSAASSPRSRASGWRSALSRGAGSAARAASAASWRSSRERHGSDRATEDGHDAGARPHRPPRVRGPRRRPDPASNVERGA